MSREKFRTVVKALVTKKGEILIGKKEEQNNHPISGEWHIIGGHLEHGEEIEEAVKREVKEETGLEVEVHQVIDVMSFPWNDGDERDSLQILFHCQTIGGEAKPKDDLEEIKWVEPDQLKEELNDKEAERLEEREEQATFLEKLKQMPIWNR
jgi:8-oxo-dGTP diphosphatase